MDHLSLIYRDLTASLKTTADNNNNSLLCGDWGILLYLFYYEHYIDGDADNALDLLQQLYSRLDETGAEGYTFCNGLTGPFWMLHHLNQQGIVEIDLDALVNGFLPAAIAESEQHLKENNFDFLHGSTGIVHFLVHFAHIPHVKDHLCLFVTALKQMARFQNNTISFPTFTSLQHPHATDGLSMAHGSCALLVILARLHQAGVVPEACKELIYGNIALILQGRNVEGIPSSPYASLYPEALNGKASWSRLSWCYGDLSVALALWHCGNYFGEESWCREAIAIVSYNTCRTIEYSGVKDSCLCHGAAGAAIIFRKFWKETGIASFYDSSEYWFQQVLADPSFETHQQQNGLRVATVASHIYRSNLLSGSAGVGLALLSKVQDRLPAWSGCFLIDHITDI